MKDYDPVEEMVEESRKIGKVMNKNVIFTEPDISIQHAAQMMKQHGIGSLVVRKEGRVTGIVTTKDVVYKYVANEKGKKVEDIMTKNVITVSPQKNIEDAALLMAKKGIERLPVQRNGEIVGIITASDLMKIHPELYLDLLEALKYGEERFETANTGTDIGQCDSCGNYSDDLQEVSGEMICPECREEL